MSFLREGRLGPQFCVFGRNLNGIAIAGTTVEGRGDRKTTTDHHVLKRRIVVAVVLESQSRVRWCRFSITLGVEHSVVTTVVEARDVQPRTGSNYLAVKWSSEVKDDSESSIIGVDTGNHELGSCSIGSVAIDADAVEGHHCVVVAQADHVSLTVIRRIHGDRNRSATSGRERSAIDVVGVSTTSKRNSGATHQDQRDQTATQSGIKHVSHTSSFLTTKRSK